VHSHSYTSQYDHRRADTCNGILKNVRGWVPMSNVDQQRVDAGQLWFGPTNRPIAHTVTLLSSVPGEKNWQFLRHPYVYPTIETKSRLFRVTEARSVCLLKVCKLCHLYASRTFQRMKRGATNKECIAFPPLSSGTSIFQTQNRDGDHEVSSLCSAGKIQNIKTQVVCLL
jgi:hypothetical protein